MAPALHARRRAAPDLRPAAGKGVVVSYCAADAHNPRSHESVTRNGIAERLAALKGCSFGGEFARDGVYAGAVYFVPSATIVGCDGAAALGIRCADDLFGGVVPYPFVGTKTITHPLIDADAHAPAGWSSAFCDAV